MKTTDRFKKAMRQVRRQLPSLVALSFLCNLLLLASALYIYQVFDRVLSSGSISTLIWLTIITLGAIAVFGLLDHFRKLILNRIGSWVDTELSPFVIRDAIRAKLSTGKVDANLNDVADLRSFLAGDAFLAFLDAPWTPVFIAIIWVIHPWLGAIAVGGAVILFGLALVNNSLTRRKQGDAISQLRESRMTASQYIQNSETVAALGMTNTLIARWFRSQSGNNGQLVRATDTTALLTSISRSVRLAIQVVIISVAAWLVLLAETTPGGLIASSIILGRALSPVERAIGAWRVYGAYRIAKLRLAQLFAKAADRTSTFNLPAPKGQLRLETVHFIPPGSSEAVLKHVDLALDPGETCGIIGPSGSGKSTLCRIIVGVWKPSFGTALLDGAEIGTWDSEKLGRYIGYLPQQVELFEGTVAENIARMTRASDEEIVAAARLAGAHKAILKLPDGYDTKIGANSAILSGGQKQRIGLARAFFRLPPLIVLDEPALNLDGEGEAALIKTCEELKSRGHTTIIVAHQPKLMRSADKILLIKDGIIHAFGKREDVFKTVLAHSHPRSDIGELKRKAAE